VLAAVSGVASEIALRAVAPASASALALCVMAIGLIGSAWLVGRKSEVREPVPRNVKAAAGESLAPV
jgi:hypothetical protein